MCIYQDEYNKQIEDEVNKIDLEAWKHGQYIVMAVAAAMDSKNKYPSKPFSLEEEEENGLTDAERFEIWAKQFNTDNNLQSSECLEHHC